MGAAAEESVASTYSRRLAGWAREAGELRAASGDPAVAPEVAALARYRRSRTTTVRLPHPLVMPRRSEALSRRRRGLARRASVLMALTPMLVVLGAVVDPLAVQAALWALLVPIAGLAVHDRLAVRAIDGQRQVTLRAGVADAWSDWLAARTALAELPEATDARAALAVREDRMHTLVLSLAADPTTPGDPQSPTHEAIYRHAAAAVALVDAEQRLELTRHLMAIESATDS